MKKSCDGILTSCALVIMFNPRRMRKWYGSHSVYVCVSVCLLLRQLLYTWFMRCKQGAKVPLGFSRHLQGMNCVDFVENASFKRSGNIC